MSSSKNISACTHHCLTDLQKRELELLKQFDAVCEKLQLRYFLVCGSALGAVKYQGFIPWDDDVDVALFREDYEIFLARAPELLPPEVFLQNTYTDPQVPFIYSKLRNSNTTFVERSCANLSMHHGIYMDVFPLDGYPSDPLARILLEMRKKYYTYLLYTPLDIPRRPYAKVLNALLGRRHSVSEVARKYSRMISRYPVSGSALICNHGNWQGRREYAAREQYADGTPTSFEGLKVYVPRQYDAYLTQKYGNWRADIPDAQKVGHHTCLICDPDRPYTDYKGEMS